MPGGIVFGRAQLKGWTKATYARGLEGQEDRIWRAVAEALGV